MFQRHQLWFSCLSPSKRTRSKAHWSQLKDKSVTEQNLGKKRKIHLKIKLKLRKFGSSDSYAQCILGCNYKRQFLDTLKIQSIKPAKQTENAVRKVEEWEVRLSPTKCGWQNKRAGKSCSRMQERVVSYTSNLAESCCLLVLVPLYRTISCQ